MTNVDRSTEQLLRENEELRRRLEEAEEILRAIRRGEVDAFVVATLEEAEVLTLGRADRPYRLLAELMGQGAATLGEDGTVLYANHRFAELLGAPPPELIGTGLSAFVPEADRPHFERLLRQ